MKLLIFGASGATGVHLVRQALEAGHQVSAFVRSAQKLTFQHPQLRIIEGNVRETALVRKSITGQDAVLSALGAHHPLQFDPVVVKGLHDIVEAMNDKGVRRLIYLSTLTVAAARRQAGVLPRMLAHTLLRNEVRGHELREQLIRYSSLDWTIVRAPILSNTRARGGYTIDTNPHSNSFMPRMPREDVALALMDQLEQDRHIRQSLTIKAYQTI